MIAMLGLVWASVASAQDCSGTITADEAFALHRHLGEAAVRARVRVVAVDRSSETIERVRQPALLFTVLLHG